MKEKLYVIVFPNHPMYLGVDHYYQNDKVVFKRGAPCSRSWHVPVLTSHPNEAHLFEKKLFAESVLKELGNRAFVKGFSTPYITKAFVKVSIEKVPMKAKKCKCCGRERV